MTRDKIPIDETHVSNVEAQLARLHAAGPAPRKTWTRQAMVERMDAKLTALRAAGFSLEEIADAMSYNGVTFSAEMLSSYLSRLRHGTASNGVASRTQSKKASRKSSLTSAPTTNRTTSPPQDTTRDAGHGRDDVVSLVGIRPIQHRVRAEDHAGRIDPTACQDMMAAIGEAPEPFVVIDFPAGDTDTTQRCAEIIVGECHENDIRLIVVVIVGPVDPTPLKVLPSLLPLLRECDRPILAKNTHTGVNFEYLEGSEVYQELQALPSIHITEIEPIGERITEALRVHNVPWDVLATATPMRIRVEARRLRRKFHDMWLEAIAHEAV
ncbi:hypothetical protein [Methylorubrum populi]|uniref:hypothetical protein n=1 Tax=Methylorubrum populi TaxID=223967 RepID=UPI0023540DF0|nr:hypothetical protein [Methylorubrum populi]